MASTPADVSASWALTRAVSPRGRVRVAVRDAHGEILNLYPRHRSVDGPVPGVPWAMPLADEAGAYRLLCFDLDAHGPGGRAGAAADAAALVEELSRAGLDALVCESGPSGGRHVWVGLAESAPAELVAAIARRAREVCPSVDIAPLTNARTGAVRPPGAPHREGGRSRCLSGDLSVLTSPRGTRAQLTALLEALTARSGHSPTPTSSSDVVGVVLTDEHGHPHLPGRRRELPAYAAHALVEDAGAPGADASRVLWRVLIGAAAAHWHQAEVEVLVAAGRPGMEHVRTAATHGRRRRPRSEAETARTLAHHWARAVRHVAGRGHGHDDTFEARAGAIAAHIGRVQDRADACPGRWVRGSGPADRRVLDGLCQIALEAVTPAVGIDVRRLALMVGIGRETARTALLRLAAEGWIAQVSASAGTRAAVWTTDPHDAIHRTLSEGRSQDVTPPPPSPSGAADRLALLHTLTTRTTTAAHDAFTPSPGLGLAAGNAYARLPERTAGAEAALQLLDDAGLTRPGSSVPGSTGRCDELAAQLGVAGRLERRAATYTVERQLWLWWQAETDWMTAPTRTGHHRRPQPGQAPLPGLSTGAGQWPAYPRDRAGRAHHAAARRLLTPLPQQPAPAEAPAVARGVQDLARARRQAMQEATGLYAAHPDHTPLPHATRLQLQWLADAHGDALLAVARSRAHHAA